MLCYLPKSDYDRTILSFLSQTTEQILKGSETKVASKTIADTPETKTPAVADTLNIADLEGIGGTVNAVAHTVYKALRFVQVPDKIDNTAPFN